MLPSSLGTSSVNLIWRHLATLPGALPWCWNAIAPLLRAGELGDLARDYRKGLDGLPLPQVPVEVLEVLGLRPDDIAQISSMLRGYHVSCTMNVLSLNALLLVLKGAKAGVEHEAAPRACRKVAAFTRP